MANNPALNIHKVLEWCDTNQYTWYSSLTDEEKKGLVPFVAQRWMSGTKSDVNFVHHYYLITTNVRVNVHHGMSSKKPELFSALLASCGVGFKTDHHWIKGPVFKKESSQMVSLLEEWIGRSLNHDEITILKSCPQDQVKSYLMDLGMDDKTIKEIMKQWGKFIG